MITFIADSIGLSNLCEIIGLKTRYNFNFQMVIQMSKRSSLYRFIISALHPRVGRDAKGSGEFLEYSLIDIVNFTMYT